MVPEADRCVGHDLVATLPAFITVLPLESVRSPTNLFDPKRQLVRCEPGEAGLRAGASLGRGVPETHLAKSVRFGYTVKWSKSNAGDPLRCEHKSPYASVPGCSVPHS